jgi:hypothetical protein
VGDGGRGEVEVERTVVDTRHIATSTGLVLLRLKAEGVDVDTGRRYVGVVLVWLYQVKVASVALREAVVAVKLYLGGENRVLATVEKRSTSGVHETVPASNTEWLVVATPREVASGRAASTEHVLYHTRVESSVTGRVDLRGAFTNVIPSATVRVTCLDVARSGVGTAVLALSLLVLVVETLVLKALFTWVAVTLVDATGLVQVNVFLVAGTGTTIVALIILKSGTSTILGEWESTLLAVGMAIAATAATGTLFAWPKGVVVATGKLATLGGASSHVSEPFVGGSIPVAVEVDSLVGKTKVEILGVDHASTKGVVGGTTKVGNINCIREVKVLWTAVWEGRDKINVGVGLYNPDKLLNRVVKVKLNLVAGRVDRLSTRELELFDQILMRYLGEATALICVKINVIDVKRS